MICDHEALIYKWRRKGKEVYRCLICGAFAIFDKPPVVTQEE